MALKYLGLWFDGKLTFKEHSKWTSVKAGRDVARISQIMFNLGGPSEVGRKLLANIAMSVLLYRAQSGLTPSMPESTKEERCFGPMEGYIKVCQCLLHCLHSRYTPDRDSCG